MPNPLDKTLCRGWSDGLGDDLSRAFAEGTTDFERKIDAAHGALSAAKGPLSLAEAVSKIPVPGVPAV